MKEKIRDFSKIHDAYELPGLLDVQVDSYRSFLQKDMAADQRKDRGLEEGLREVFPIESYDGQIRLEYLSYSMGKEKYSCFECQRRGMTYSAPLKVKLRLVTPVDIKEQEVYFGDFPLMTDTGTFIINGDERVVVSQIQRSPGGGGEQPRRHLRVGGCVGSALDFHRRRTARGADEMDGKLDRRGRVQEAEPEDDGG